MRYVVVDGCPCPAQLAPTLRKILAASGARLQSCYRGDDAERLLHQLGKHSQQELFDAWRHREPGANPANRPGFSTHELRNDGKAYTRWPRGARIPWWACGLDVDDAHVGAFIHEAAKRGFTVSRTYPDVKREFHHLNFRKPPVRRRLAGLIAAAREPLRARWARTGVSELSGALRVTFPQLKDTDVDEIINYGRHLNEKRGGA